MKTINNYKNVLIIAIIFLVSSCTNFDELTDDPNRATSVPPSMPRSLK
jgi:hypothetical protein